ncbi:MAG: beta-glucosidase (EC @ beta-D-fucosidase (EC [uncultured Paraburkholderia sp.]|uniref:GH1 family beta-glucosidase n=1 Tax=uncultured Paraburkholderia sp. TaxID=1822466 RepID=UPI00259774B7|nr:GH1 family beta-glucosidase [uncultured Paraburkholderia sp.]CAH2903220.1 MAG: beta-glucosidase (EC @ beta-D-fucosidase (EC [uncultured Paraburkholderia sp.]CAH2939394.1 MAG: beta-glucosidase (EC @ beta-D-fucosidase (EC [uncultured Paraburkholderia sp.]
MAHDALSSHSSADPFTPAADSALWRKNFLLGAATASYQIEGAVNEDGRLPSIWDTFCATPGKVLAGDSGAVACDHYHRWESDVDMLVDLGLEGYRLSIAWPRVMDANGAPNRKGLDFYKRLLTRLKEKGITTFVTLYHWDLPQHLEDRGGWLNRETAYRFADYADLMSRELAGTVDAWATLNEPWCSAYLGYGNGHHAPGLANGRFATQAMHHLLLAHGLALPVLRENDPSSQKGIVANVGRGTPNSDSAEDQRAAQLFEIQHNAWILDPLLKGAYPEALFELWPGTEPLILGGDMQIISAPLDFLGINYYFRTNVASDGAHGFTEVPLEGVERTQMGWEVYPDGLRDLLIGFNREYANLPPVYITENGMASDDTVIDGRVNDTQRISFLKRHLAAVDEAIKAGVDIRGYFLWSLMDNFEWAFGYERRFGIVHVDYVTQKRTMKRSAELVSQFLKERKERSQRA